MRNRKSRAEDFYLRLFIASLTEVASASAYSDVEFKRDLREIENRVCHEGLSFLTKTVPSLAKAVDTALANASPVRIRGFCLKRGSQLPLFLGWLLRNIFNDTGCERSDACTDSLKWLRQVCTLLYKLEVPTTEQQNEDTIATFVETDNSLSKTYEVLEESGDNAKQHAPDLREPIPVVPDSKELVTGVVHGGYRNVSMDMGPERRLCAQIPAVNSSSPRRRSERFDSHASDTDEVSHDPRDSSSAESDTRSYLSKERRVDDYARFQWIQQAAILVKRVAAMVDPKAEPFRARHGTGSVSTGEDPHEKAVFQRYYHDLHKVFPYGEYFMYSWGHYADTFDVKSLEEFRHGTAKVVLVPKDSRGPRLISCEPLEYQWIQQGLRRQLERAIDECPLTHGRINFRNQAINRDLALRGSNGEPWVTLDMKDASDRVTLALVKLLFPEPWLTCLLASRTPATRLPSGEVHTMNKFAPMGSSLCFPVESLVFWSLSIAAIMRTHALTASQASTLMYVFGDDLIVRREVYATVLQHLPLVDLKFNESKCCVAGSFRESCGCDAYKGVDVTPLRVKSTWDPSIGTSIASYAVLHNAAMDRGMFHLADCVSAEMRKHIKLPYAESAEVGYVCLVDHRKTAAQRRRHNKQFPRRYNRGLQRWEIRSWAVHTRPYQASVPGWAEMQRIASLSGISSQEADEYCLAPVSAELVRVPPTSKNYKMFLPRKLMVTAYQYAFPRQATLRRGWFAT